MPPREWRLRIADILDAIAAIQSYTQEMDYEMFIQDRRTVDAVLRNLTVIGEAATYVPDDIVARHPEIPISLGEMFERMTSSSDVMSRCRGGTCAI
jgi:uncharacterized protein with HEPN domain